MLTSRYAYTCNTTAYILQVYIYANHNGAYIQRDSKYAPQTHEIWLYG